jgi:hypothetical protein
MARNIEIKARIENLEALTLKVKAFADEGPLTSHRTIPSFAAMRAVEVASLS